ncbi:hypothetical protein AGMMS49975_21420 [Clostridia bacterium]|nr:hypothetical protein AGMMS49975_21420 [Clostridia bacterium]
MLELVNKRVSQFDGIFGRSDDVTGNFCENAACKREKGAERNRMFRELNKQYGLEEYAIHTYIKNQQKHFKENIDSFTAQKIATRALCAFEKLLYKIGKNVRFKRYGELNSLEGKINQTGIRYKDGSLLCDGLKVDVIIKLKDMYAHFALKSKIKYCRIKRELVNGKMSYYIQLILEGQPAKKNH